MQTLVAPLAGLVCGLINVGLSYRRFARGEESSRSLMQWAGITAVLTLTGWQFRNLGVAFVVGYPIMLALVETVYVLRARREKQVAASTTTQLPSGEL